VYLEDCSPNASSFNGNSVCIYLTVIQIQGAAFYELDTFCMSNS